jgi:hypothetical protein
MTLTVRHDAARPLAESLSGLLRAFTILMNSKTMRRLKKTGVIFGFYRALEVTYGTKSAWHPHLHVLVLTTDLAALKREWRTEKDEDGVSHGIKVEWGKALNKASEELGFDRKLGAMQRHQDLRVATVDDAGRLAGYLTKDGTKWSAAAEMTRLDVKEGRVENLGPIQLLVAAGNGDLRALARWHEFVRATKGVHHLEASYYDFKTRTRITEYLHDVLERFEFRDENAAIGVGAKDDPRVVTNREVLDARDEAFEALPSDQRWAYGRRRRDAEQAERSMQPVMRPVASFERSEELSGKDGRVTLTELYRDPRPLYDLMHAIESVRDVKDVRGVARQVALELGLPISTEERPARAYRGVDEDRVDYRQRRADLETRLTDKGLDEDEIEQRLDAFDEKNKPFDSSRYMRHVRQIERGKVLSAVRNAFTGAMRTKGRSEEEIERFVGTFRANNSDENMFA